MSDSSASSLPPLDTLRPWIDRFDGLTVLLWGDIVADRFLYGSTTRVSREAPALVLKYESEETRPGAAGNAMNNVAALGARVIAAGYVADDGPGSDLLDSLQQGGIRCDRIVRRHDGSTPVKTRVMAGGVHTVRQQVLRIDQEARWPSDPVASERLMAEIRAALGEVDAVLISDYSLGTVDPEMYLALRNEIRAHRLPVFLDSRAAVLDFPGVAAATPNEGEVEEALRLRLGGDTEALEAAGRELLERLECEALLVTRGSCGMSLFEPGAAPHHIEIHGSQEIADVTGAGDAVIATFALGWVAGATALEAARLSNVAGGVAVMKRGTAAVSATELAEAIERGE